MMTTTLPVLLHKGPTSLHFAVSPSALYGDREKFYRDELSTKTLGVGITRWENPFSLETFPMMNNINYSVMFQHGELIMPDGDFREYEEDIKAYKEARYVKKEGERQLNNSASSLTEARVYNIDTKDVIKKILEYHLDHGTALVIKLVDLGQFYYEYRYKRADGDSMLGEIYNEVRAGFFLNELLYAYEKIPTHHFMQIIDWFVSDTNLYPEKRGHGPYQYFVAEKLDYNMEGFLSSRPDKMLTLRCTLFCVAQALEAGWYSHQYLHYDLHCNNVMLKNVANSAECYNKDYMYTRPLSDIVYRLPKKGLHNCLVKIIDFGRNRMNIPSVPRDKRDLHEHIGNNANPRHKHDETLSFVAENLGIGTVNNRIWDIRRLLWSIVFDFPASYWAELRKDKEYYPKLLAQINKFVDIDAINKESVKHKPTDIHDALKPAKKNTNFTIENIMDLSDMFKESDIYAAWAKAVAAKVIYSEEVKESPNVETFLDSDLFESFKIEATEVNEGIMVWMGRWSSV